MQDARPLEEISATAEPQQEPGLLLAMLPLLVLFGLLAFNVHVYGDDSLSGANQTALIIAAAVAAALGLLGGRSWTQLQDGMLDNIRAATPAILILLMVGALTGAWLLGGIVPTMIYYGLEIFNPAFFIFSACLLMALTAVVIGSSWSSSATLGVALMSIGLALGFHPGLIAGAIISGAYFGDKLSPLSDTTNLAAGVSGVELFTHIRYLSLTTLPSLLISLALYLLLGFFVSSAGESDTSTEVMQQLLRERFNLSPLLLLVPLSVILLIVKKIPALPALFVGTLLGVASAVVLQYPLLQDMSAELGGPYQVIMQALYGDLGIAAGDPLILDELLTAGGMAGMLNTIWLIIAAMIFGGSMEASGFLGRITRALISRVSSNAGLVSATAGTCVLTNVSASDQYLSIVVPGRMFTQAYRDRGLAPQNLSRTLEDSGTVTSVLVPWNTCAAFHAGVLGVATLSYAPWAFFCLISPLMTLAFAWLRVRIAYL